MLLQRNFFIFWQRNDRNRTRVAIELGDGEKGQLKRRP